MPNFQRYERQFGRRLPEPLVSLQRNGVLALNLAAYEALGRPEAIALLFDPDERIIGLQPTTPEDLHAFTVRKNPRAQHYALAMKSFADHYGIALGETRRYRAEPMDGLLAVRLEQQPADGDQAPANNGHTATAHP